ncbi:hypothetical protein P4C99_17850 [Pontiellaceae bacterium B1224]|nr:hypothetical protein [Pontiellaceae bacterium B1224]
MEIGFTTSSASAVKYDIEPSSRIQNGQQNAECDTVCTSKQALLLSRSLTGLKEQLAPRNELIQQFAGKLDDPVELDDSSLDRIFDGLLH